MNPTKLSDFDYDLPPELIAQAPAAQRDSSRMMVVRRGAGTLEHSIFYRLPEYLRQGDLLVMNNTRVVPARLLGRRAGDGAAVELLLLQRLEENRWVAMVRPGRKLKPGAAVDLGPELAAVIDDYAGRGRRVVSFSGPGPLGETLSRLGKVPLPPYITQEIADPSLYQTIYASADGSVAAPTAGFHFTPAVFEHLQSAGIEWAYITLHIGPGTFQPVKVEDFRTHTMHSESFELTAETAERINESRTRGSRVVAVGTTACRVLETAASAGAALGARNGETGLFIYPGFNFRAVDVLLTNFHLPRSTLLMLVSAFAGHSLIMEAYREAVRERYRFYSFGDCMLIL